MEEEKKSKQEIQELWRTYYYPHATQQNKIIKMHISNVIRTEGLVARGCEHKVFTTDGEKTIHSGWLDVTVEKSSA